MKLLSISPIIAFLASAQLISALLVNRAEPDSLEPFLGVQPQILQGNMAIFNLEHPSRTISKIELNLKGPDGTLSSPFSSNIFTNTTRSPSIEPVNRFCVNIGAFERPAGGFVWRQKIEQTGNWSVSLRVTYFYGADGYEYSTENKVCISPPFTSEVANTKPIAMVVVPSTGGLSTSAAIPSASDAPLQGTVTGSPFITSTSDSPTSDTTTNGATGTATNGAVITFGWNKEIGALVVAAAISIFML